MGQQPPFNATEPRTDMNLSLPPELETLIRQKIDSGQYDSFPHVIREALMLLEERDQVALIRRDRLLKEIAIGVYQADNRQVVDNSEVFRVLRKKPDSSDE